MNSVEAMPEGGEIFIEVELQEISGKETLNFVNLKEGKYHKVRMKDTGRGIEKKDIGKVWEPFYTTKQDKASGLGLSIVFGVILAHQGDISIESAPGKGTTMTIYLPCFSEKDF